MTLRFVLVMDEESQLFTVGPEDEHTQAWLVNNMHRIHSPLVLAERQCVDQLMTTRLAREAAQMLEYRLNHEAFTEHPEERGTFRVRACRRVTRVVTITTDLEEL
jgi:hypothetical protein